MRMFGRTSRTLQWQRCVYVLSDFENENIYVPARVSFLLYFLLYVVYTVHILTPIIIRVHTAAGESRRRASAVPCHDQKLV